MLDRVKQLVNRITLSCLGKEFKVLTNYDCKGGDRVFIQIVYSCECTKGGNEETWKGRKYYLSEHMTDDEIIKTVYTAFEQCIKHEVMEGFKIDNKVLFNPHINFEELLKISHKEVVRKNK